MNNLKPSIILTITDAVYNSSLFSRNRYKSCMNLLLGAYVLLLVSVFELLYPSDDLCELRIGCIGCVKRVQVVTFIFCQA